MAGALLFEMKRFSETTKWADPWFMDLPSKWKLLWLFLLDSCDSAGVWQPNIRLASVQIGEPFEASEAVRILSGRVGVLPSGKWHILKFVEYQYGELSEACRPHQQVLSLIKTHGLERVSKGYPKGIDTLQDKDKDQDKDQDQGSRGIAKGETCAALPFDSEEFAAVWKLWNKHRSEIRKPLKPTMEAAQLAELASIGETRAISAIRHTIAKGWQGIREPDARDAVKLNPIDADKARDHSGEW